MAKQRKDPNEGKPQQEPRVQYVPPDQEYPVEDPGQAGPPDAGEAEQPAKGGKG